MSENRTFKRFPDNDYTRKLTSHFSNSGSTPVTTHYESPGQVPRRRGQILVFLLLAALLAGAGYLVWNSFIRYEAYGVVEANIVGLSSPVEGEIRRLNIQYGQRVEKDQVVAEVVNTDDLRDIAKIDDEINVTQAEIKAKRSELLWKTSSNNEEYHKAESELESALGDLTEFKSRRVLLEKNLDRFGRLKKSDAVSQFELDKAQADYASVQAQISAKNKTITALRNRVAKFKVSVKDKGDAQVLPLAQRLDFLRNEKQRLEQKIDEGRIVSPVAGTVSQINHLAGERVSREPIVNIVEEGTTKLVLYYRADKQLPKAGDRLDLWISSLGSYVPSRVEGNSKDTFSAPNQIKRKYNEDERLVRVFLEPTEKQAELVVGGVIMKPTSLGKIANTVMPELLASK